MSHTTTPQFAKADGLMILKLLYHENSTMLLLLQQEQGTYYSSGFSRWFKAMCCFGAILELSRGARAKAGGWMWGGVWWQLRNDFKVNTVNTPLDSSIHISSMPSSKHCALKWRIKIQIELMMIFTYPSLNTYWYYFLFVHLMWHKLTFKYLYLLIYL